jgi:hypothetical protein
MEDIDLDKVIAAAPKAECLLNGMDSERQGETTAATSRLLEVDIPTTAHKKPGFSTISDLLQIITKGIK